MKKIKEKIKIVCIAKPLFGDFEEGKVYTATKTYTNKNSSNIKYSLPYIADVTSYGIQGISLLKMNLNLYHKRKNSFEKFSNFFITLAEYRNNQINEILND